MVFALSIETLDQIMVGKLFIVVRFRNEGNWLCFLLESLMAKSMYERFCITVHSGHSVLKILANFYHMVCFWNPKTTNKWNNRESFKINKAEQQICLQKFYVKYHSKSFLVSSLCYKIVVVKFLSLTNLIHRILFSALIFGTFEIFTTIWQKWDVYFV